MIEYIERAALKERFQKRLIWLKKDVHDEYSKGLYHGCETDMGLIDEILAANVVEVRHGRWIDSDGNPITWDDVNKKCPAGSAYCSECGEWLTGSDEYPAFGVYCPNCGAMMDKEDEYEAM